MTKIYMKKVNGHVAFYTSDIHENLESDHTLIEITKEAHKEFLENQGTRDFDENGNLVVVQAPPSKPIPEKERITKAQLVDLLVNKGVLTMADVRGALK